MSQTQEKFHFNVVGNLFRGKEAVGGRLKINDRSILFSSHSMNIQTGNTEIFIDQISTIRKRITLGLVPNGILIETLDGQQFKFVVWNRQKIIDFIMSRIIK